MGSTPSRQSKNHGPQGQRIIAVSPHSPADRCGIRPGDSLLAIGGHAVRDAIDVRFHGACERARIEITRDGAPRARVIRKPYEEDLGLEIEPFAIRPCRNNCVFCFCRQHPAGARRSLLFRDDDYRMSFLQGHYITGANLTPADLARIEEQRLAPLYLSVHATDAQIRGALLGRRSPAPILPLLDFLAQRRLAFHAQIVLCPGLNDGAALARSLDELTARHPACQSVAIVPVGLTASRQGLPRLRPVTPRYARELLDWAAPLRRRLARKVGGDIVFFSDEWYLLARRPLPDYGRREYWHQLENGVGMVHEFYKGFSASRLPRRLRSPRAVALITGRLGAQALEPLVTALNTIDNVRVRALATRNTFFGASVTVSGLLSGADVLRAIARHRGRFDRFLLPPNCLSSGDLLFVDGLTWAELVRRAKAPVAIGGETAAGVARDALGDR